MTWARENFAGILQVVFVTFLYGFALYGAIRNYRKNQTVAWGMGAGIVVLIAARLTTIKEIPLWLPGSLIALFFLLGIYTVCLGIRDVLNWARQRRLASNARSAIPPENPARNQVDSNLP
jgi:hypothetical protein